MSVLLIVVLAAPDIVSAHGTGSSKVPMASWTKVMAVETHRR